jgi:flagellar basal-body rod modification protein FlgD
MATEAAALPITNLINTGTSTTATSSASTNSATSTSTTAANQTLGESDFLTLLTTQLQNQNPLSPMDDTQSVAELAQFSSLQATSNLASSFSTFESNSAVTQAGSLLGKSVSVSSTDSSGNSSTVAGTINSIQVVNGQPEFTMLDASGNPINGSNGTPIQFTTSQILTIQ